MNVPRDPGPVGWRTKVSWTHHRALRPGRGGVDSPKWTPQGPIPAKVRSILVGRSRAIGDNFRILMESFLLGLSSCPDFRGVSDYRLGALRVEGFV